MALPRLIEAYDQPWKRQLEGAVGGHWGLYDAYQRKPKFTWGAPVSNHPQWRWQAAAGVGLAVLMFGAALAACWLHPPPPARVWLGIAASAAVSGTAIGWTIEKIPIESLTAGDWVRSLGWGAVTLLAPVAGAVAAASEAGIPSFSRVIGRRADRVKEPLTLALGVLLIALTLLAVEAALGLVFDPRYRDFPFAALIGAAVPFLVLMTARPRLKDLRPSAETVAAAALALSAIYIVFNETVANWQALWFAGGLVVLAVILAPGRDAPDLK